MIGFGSKKEKWCLCGNISVPVSNEDNFKRGLTSLSVRDIKCKFIPHY